MGAAAIRTWYADVPRSARGATLGGLAVLVFVVFGFGAWATLAPLSSAVVTAGTFTADGQNRIVQHLEGGVIKDILVQEGDVVEEGQPLIELDETAAKAELERLLLREDKARVVAARLEAEAEWLPEPRFPDASSGEAGQGGLSDMIAEQRRAFVARRATLDSQIGAMEAGIAALNDRIEGSKAQKLAADRQVALVQQELADKKALFAKGLVRRSDVLLLERARASLDGERARLDGEIGDANERIARSQEQIEATRADFVTTSLNQLQEVTAELNDLRERIRAARRVMERIVIVSPARGVVAKLRYHTLGGVIEPGKPILEIVPLGEELIVEGRIRPQDIDVVKLGQHAMIRLNALNQRVTPIVGGEVIYVSADAMPDERRGAAGAGGDIFVVRVKLDPDALRDVPGFTPSPGMPAELYIRTADRTFMDYLTAPIRDTFSRAFREQ